MPEVTVAIPVRDGGELFEAVLAALARQSVAHELLVCDSGSRDGSARAARAHGARVLELAAERFNHGTTRNLLVQEAGSEYVALLTQDAEPADERWLERLLGGFGAAADVGLVYGPYLPRPGASAAVSGELERWFGSLGGGGTPMPAVERLAADELELPAVALVGRRGFFSDANACIARAAWERVPFRALAYAEDRALALDMLRAGYAKVFVPDAAVLHSHEYGWLGQLRRSFDEGRGLREVYGWRESASPRYALGQLRGEIAAARRDSPGVPDGRTRAPGGVGYAALVRVAWHRLARLLGGILGTRADALPPWARQRLSLERRAGFETPAGTGSPLKQRTP
jgi:rhamnosyltransferase